MPINTKYKWIHFTLQVEYEKTKLYNCYNNESNAFLGQVKWYSGFRKYSFFPEHNIVFESTCLTDIASFLDNLMREKKVVEQNNSM